MSKDTAAQSKANQATIAYRLLKQDIIKGIHQPGDKLLMSHLKESYDIGAGPMREALSQLVADRLVTAISQRGFRVAEMSLEELTDIYDARAHLEALITELAVERGDDSWEATVLGEAHKLSRVNEVNSPEEMLEVWDSRHKSFHNAIANGCSSVKLLELRMSLLDQAERYRQLWLRQTVFSQSALEGKRQEHSDLVDALLDRDKARAKQLMYEHILSPIPVIRNLLP
ncbi:DNA-binding transcriptional regulator CsiR [Oceanospirillum sediminis]|uniref:DNA-binding transcriptional regulator CsiR n=1 Tax=Oceanospirillum sediminis TaxID=2760088 RepID=A0A839IPK5_9GAMM|nr:DNA-binding transcriptional regulator CsiR [Oceanospirillum sediminis]MBB1486888.1 DNA-binding transcriptional regulator CsiR [Oceanospirillum sediminis]